MYMEEMVSIADGEVQDVHGRDGFDCEEGE